MKTVLLAGAAVLSVFTTAAQAYQIPKFQAFDNYTLECESVFSDRKHVSLEVKPSEQTVTLRNEKGESFTFPVTKAEPSVTQGRNEFGNHVMVPYVSWLEFRDNGGNTRVVLANSPTPSWPTLRGRMWTWSYMPRNSDQRWGYSCIPQ